MTGKGVTSVATGEMPAAEREQLILENLSQVRLVARRIHERLPDKICLDDLISAGTIGLIAAVDNYDAAEGVKLKTYAEYRIRGAILDSLRSLDWAPRPARKVARQIETSISRLEQMLGRKPEEDEIAGDLGIPIDEYRNWLSQVDGLQLMDLETTEGDDDTYSLLNFIPDDVAGRPLGVLEAAELQRLLARCLDQLPDTERKVLSLYYLEELSLKEIGTLLDLHYSRISQLKSQAILRLRGSLIRKWPIGRRMSGL